MKSKRPYQHILKNLFHEQATEIIPLLLPKYRVVQVIDVELPDLKSTELERPPNDLEKGLEELAQRFQGDDSELGRHLTKLSLLLQQSEMMSEEEKLAAQGHLKRLAHLIKHDSVNE